jgi:hypothetical protein
MKSIDLIGQVFGRLTVVSRETRRMSGRNRTYWFCRCSCGNEVSVVSDSLIQERTQSCGCLLRESSTERHISHGLSHTAEFSVWCAMRKRCGNPKDIGFHNYGGRGIRVCDRWLGKDGFTNFLTDVGRRPSPKHTLDRIDNDGDYCPTNCVWATRAEQLRHNRRNNVITFNGKTMILQDWVNEIGISRSVLDTRLRRGWTVERAFTTPVQYIRKS